MTADSKEESNVKHKLSFVHRCRRKVFTQYENLGNVASIDSLERYHLKVKSCPQIASVK